MGPQGTLSVDAKSEEMFVWKPVGNESIISSGSSTVRKSEIASIDWLYTTKGYEVRIWKSEDDFVELLGFKETDFEILEGQITQLQLEKDIHFGKVDVCLKGVNWGRPTIKGSHMMMHFEDKEIFSISLADDIKNCQKNPKNSELILEFRDDDNADKNAIQLTEIRFVCPDEVEENVADITAEHLHKEISEKADLSKDLGNAVATFQQMPVVIPRGKYNVDLYKTYLRLYGRTYAHKINYKQISTLFLLPKPGQQHWYLVISLDVPFRQGQKSHFHIVFQIEKNIVIKPDDPLVIRLEKKEIEETYAEHKITSKMSGKTYEVFAKVLRALTGKKLIGAGKYNSFNNEKAVKCSLKANEGFLFFLEKSVFFLHKPVVYMRHDEIKSFKFQRADSTGSGSRYFDLVVMLRNGKNHTFSNIDKNEYASLAQFLPSKGLTVENIIPRETATMSEILGAGGDDEEDDEDFVAEKSEEEDESASEGDDDEDFDKFVEGDEGLEDETEALLKDAEQGETSDKKRKKASSSSEESSKKVKK